MKTKLGISTGILAALVYFLALFQGFGIALIVLAGYILLAEGDEWLKRMAVKAIVLTVVLSIITTVIAFIPEIIDFINLFIGLFKGNAIYLEWLNRIISIINEIVYLIRKILLIVLGIKALSKSTVYVPVVDDIVNKII